MPRISNLSARRILDSRGNATVEVDVHAGDGFGRAAAPSGASTGAHEVAAWAKGGVEASLAVAREELFPALQGLDADHQEASDTRVRELDGTPNYARVGGNLAVALSLAVAKAAADHHDVPLWTHLGGAFPHAPPKPMGNVLGGGEHAVGGTDIQEFLSVPQGPTARGNVDANAWVHARVGELLEDELPGTALGKGDEGAWVAPLGNEEALELVAHACAEAGDEFGFPVRPALDVAATELHEDGVYRYRDRTLDPEEQVEFIAGLVADHELYSVEDGLAEDDWEHWTMLTRRVGDRCLLVGDDLFTTDPERVQRGIETEAANAVLVKPNQIGSLTRTVETIRLAHAHGLETVISHRSGETCDATIAHVGVAFGCAGIKTGAVGGERVAKLNELTRIEAQLPSGSTPTETL